MTRISTLLIATSLAVLPMTAFAQNLTTMQPPPGVTTAAPAASASMPKTSDPSVKTGATVTKKSHHVARVGAKPSTPAKTAEPSKS